MWRCWGSERCPPPMLQDGGFSIHGHTKIQYSSFFWRCNLYVYIYRHVCIYYIYNINTHTHILHVTLYGGKQVRSIFFYYFRFSMWRKAVWGWLDDLASVQRVVWTCFFATYGHSSMKNHIELDFVHQQDMFGRDKAHLWYWGESRMS